VLVPKAAVNEDNNAMSRQDNVGGAGKIIGVQPESQARPVQSLTHHDFWFRVARANRAHRP
jgi:hypothetical protein